MRPRTSLVLCSAVLFAALVPLAAHASQREPGYFARPATIQPLDAVSAQADPTGGSGLLMLAGFLGLIAALLTHWSRDPSCREERSFSRTDEAA